MSLFSTLRLCLPSLLLALIFQTGWSQELAAQKQDFNLTISSAMDMNLDGKTQKLTTEVDLKYGWARPKVTERILTLQQSGVRVFLDGKSTLNFIMNQHGTANVVDGKTVNVKTAEAPPATKLMLTDTYSQPLCKLTVDDNGQVVQQEIIAQAGAKSQVENGIVANCSLFHAPFFADQEEFERPIEISMGNGGFAKGVLRYSRAKNYDPQTPKFYVTGEATKDKLQPLASNPTMTQRNAKYSISGEQVFDPTLGEWSTGTLTMQVTFQFFLEEQATGQAVGTMVCKLNPNRK